MAGHDDSAYAGNHMKRADDKAFDVSSKDIEDPMKDVDLDPDLQINRRGVGEALTNTLESDCHLQSLVDQPRIDVQGEGSLL